MLTDTAAIHPFDPGNRAYRRWRRVVDEHFTVIAWETAAAGRPALVTMMDPGSGDAFTIALVESLEERDPCALLAVTATAQLLAYGPFAGEQATASAAPQLAQASPDIHATCPVPLHDPAEPTLPDSVWRGVPSDLGDLKPAPADCPSAALILLDRAAGCVATVGPFAVDTAATLWQPTPTVAPDVERLVIALRPAPADNPIAATAVS